MTSTNAMPTASPVVYLDTSAAVKLLSDERESEALRHYLDGGPTVVSSDLLETELRRIGVRHHLDQVLITAVLDGMSLTPLTRDQSREAGLFPQVGLRSLDALHLACALGIEASAILTYDIRLADAARAHGLEVIAPQ
ncbi:type II toxin-antitoxin system VapC family toxin [Paramicrobacterium fandaimingii]|uniref:type II toxin-antitoxin system VapC family toxin n=1 Tax=Paramicrobacterium fandaimingii TaxID=2708079 RepID=UPI001F2F9264|nr:type II toxin-antitoxin system VapC family toxin [Microbacterium fandaimingii]